MTRSFTCDALVLRVRPSGESNREAWFLSAEEGIIRATVFGGPKSRLRSHVAPFQRGKLWIYRDPVRDSRKVSDFDVAAWRPGLRELYERSAAASAIAETILAGHGGGGNWTGALALAEGALAALDTADEGLCERILVHFLWNWAELLGLRPEGAVCASCACEAPPDGVLWYDGREGGFLCPACAPPAGALKAGPGARRWLAAVEKLEAPAISRYTLDGPSLAQARALATALLADALGRRLKSWDF
jgi:DNA repair protein RecO (recombination protein O)